MSERNEPSSRAEELVTPHAPTLWPLVWHLLTAVAGFTGAYLSWAASPYAIWALAVAGLAMWFARISTSGD